VFGAREHDDLAHVTVLVLGQLAVLQDRPQFLPLAVGTGVAAQAGQFRHVRQQVNLSVQLGHRRGRSGRVDDVVLELLQLLTAGSSRPSLACLEGHLIWIIRGAWRRRP
jgi:hypothetical protein